MPRAEDLPGRDFVLHDVSADVPRGDGIFRFTAGFEPGRELFLAFSPTNFHAFLIAGRTEFHPRLFFNRVRVREASAASIRAGLFIRFVDVPEAKLRRLERTLLSLRRFRTESCLAGARLLLDRAAGIRFAGVPEDEIFLAPHLSAVVTEGFRDLSDRPLRFELYTTRRQSLREILDGLAATDRRYRLRVHASRLASRLYRALGLRRLERMPDLDAVLAAGSGSSG